MILSSILKCQCTVLYMYPGKIIPFNFSMVFPLRFRNILFFLNQTLLYTDYFELVSFNRKNAGGSQSADWM